MVLAAFVILASPAQAETFEIEADGDAGVQVNGRCTVLLGSDEHPIDIDRRVPFTQVIQGDGVRCTLRADGYAVIELRHDHGLTRSTTSGGRIHMSLN